MPSEIRQDVLYYRTSFLSVYLYSTELIYSKLFISNWCVRGSFSFHSPISGTLVALAKAEILRADTEKGLVLSMPFSIFINPVRELSIIVHCVLYIPT